MGNLGRVDKGKGSVGALEDLIVPNDRGPLRREPYEPSFLLVVARVDTVLKVCWLPNLNLLLLFIKHTGTVVSFSMKVHLKVKQPSNPNTDFGKHT